jgi:hypothetical protein
MSKRYSDGEIKVNNKYLLLKFLLENPDAFEVPGKYVGCIQGFLCIEAIINAFYELQDVEFIDIIKIAIHVYKISLPQYADLCFELLSHIENVDIQFEIAKHIIRGKLSQWGSYTKYDVKADPDILHLIHDTWMEKEYEPNDARYPKNIKSHNWIIHEWLLYYFDSNESINQLWQKLESMNIKRENVANVFGYQAVTTNMENAKLYAKNNGWI